MSAARGPVWFGWHDPDRKKPARQKLHEALARYQEKFPEETASWCLTSHQDAEELAAPHRRFPGDLPVEIQARGYVSRYVMYLGTEGVE